MSLPHIEVGLAGKTDFRRRLAYSLAASVFALSLYITARRSFEDVGLIFLSAPLHIVPDGLEAQVKMVRDVVPRGSTLYFISDPAEPWLVGLWQRSLYPDYIVLPVQNFARREAEESRKLRTKDKVEYSISVGNPPANPGFQWRVELPAYPNALPAVLGRFSP